MRSLLQCKYRNKLPQWWTPSGVFRSAQTFHRETPRWSLGNRSPSHKSPGAGDTARCLSKLWYVAHMDRTLAVKAAFVRSPNARH